MNHATLPVLRCRPLLLGALALLSLQTALAQSPSVFQIAPSQQLSEPMQQWLGQFQDQLRLEQRQRGARCWGGAESFRGPGLGLSDPSVWTHGQWGCGETYSLHGSLGATRVSGVGLGSNVLPAWGYALERQFSGGWSGYAGVSRMYDGKQAFQFGARTQLAPGLQFNASTGMSDGRAVLSLGLKMPLGR